MDFEAYLTALRGKTVSVIGIGVSNRPLIEKLLEKGVAVTARDKKESLGELGAELAAQGCKLKLGEDYLKDIHEDVIFRTPGLRPDVPELAAAAARGSVITSEMEAFFEVLPLPDSGRDRLRWKDYHHNHYLQAAGGGGENCSCGRQHRPPAAVRYAGKWRRRTRRCWN